MFYAEREPQVGSVTAIPIKANDKSVISDVGVEEGQGLALKDVVMPHVAFAVGINISMSSGIVGVVNDFRDKLLPSNPFITKFV